MKKCSFLILLIFILCPTLGRSNDLYTEKQQLTIKKHIYTRVLMAKYAFIYKAQGKSLKVPVNAMFKGVFGSKIWANMQNNMDLIFLKTIGGYDRDIHDCVVKSALEAMTPVFEKSLHKESFQTQFKPYYDSILAYAPLPDKNFVDLYTYYYNNAYEYHIAPRYCTSSRYHARELITNYLNYPYQVMDRVFPIYENQK